LDGRTLNIDFSTPRSNDGANFKEKANNRAKQFGDTKNSPSDTLFLGNLSFDVTNDMLTQEFSGYGTLTRVALPTDYETGAPKGFGYVTFSSVSEAQAAMEGFKGRDIAGRMVRLDFATPRTNDGASRGDRRGGMRGGRGGPNGRGGRGGFGGDRGGRGGRGGGRGGRGGSTNRGGFGDYKGTKVALE
jgi:nucleolin